MVLDRTLRQKLNNTKIIDWSNEDIKKIIDKKEIIKENIFGNKNESGFEGFVLEMMTKITFQS